MLITILIFGPAIATLFVIAKGAMDPTGSNHRETWGLTAFVTFALCFVAWQVIANNHA